MRERIDRFASEIQNKKHVLLLVNKLELCLKIEAESGTFYLSFKDGRVDFHETCMHAGYTASISGKDALLEQLFDGDLKLRQGVNMNHISTDCPFRSQLVLESLFYLARPLPV
ncbi:SCP2 sterol-binding domain-containing protein [Mesobacillus selenatarsenatis]|uniref:SCP2 domain-containing protein n=1 Tax=Mesobacillus selenatarsenatis (strain DSM 18680 / JCM 14380 / FERM P-15431 / SF-1) TaxID=1321606 RepID=A0A0A8X345_MESS1|nr:SCP2 sterol-binding domain-containing protein [Mesobacillus selenatarsenatis]GAM14348.1 hypothetical protein SAMD00020551_2497 [Mesobacillus selenatarsenatis SF-1]